jgi:hypothetical protein
MDEADLAFEWEQRNLAHALAEQRRRDVRLQPVGSCHNCESTEVGDRLFCDADCAADWEYEHSLRRKLGLQSGAEAAVH